MLVVGSRNYSSWSLRPWLLMRHLGLEFTERQFELDTPEFEAEIAKLSPTRRVPVLLARRSAHLGIARDLRICLGTRGRPRLAARRRDSSHRPRDRRRDARRLRCAARRLPDECPRVWQARADDACRSRATSGASTRSGPAAAATTANWAPTSSARSASPTRCSRRSCCACAATGCPFRSSPALQETLLADAHLRDWIEASCRETRVIPHEEVGAGA